VEESTLATPETVLQTRATETSTFALKPRTERERAPAERHTPRALRTNMDGIDAMLTRKEGGTTNCRWQQPNRDRGV